MTALLDKLHARLGDLWWYSLMIFVACRSGDAIQAFIGLWLVPKYVGVEELGAVMPLQNLSGFFAAPLSVLAAVFAKYISTYATRGEFGKVKSFIHDVISFSCILFVLCIVLAYFIAPFFYEKIRIANGLLTVLILSAGFITNISQLFTNALQGLKKFKTMSLINVIGAPVRLITLLLAMPVRALSGYVLGQATPPGTSSIVAYFSLKSDLKNIPLDTTWRRDIRTMVRYAFSISVWIVGCIIYNTLFATLVRHRLPEIESAAYYLLAKLSEIGGYFGMSLMVVLFPLASEAFEQGTEKHTVLKHSILGSFVFSGMLAFFFFFASQLIFEHIEIWKPYIQYHTLLIPATIGIGMSCATGSCVTYEMACGRFRPIWIVVSSNFLWLFFLCCILPDHSNALNLLTWVGLFFGILQFVLVTMSIFKGSHERHQ